MHNFTGIPKPPVSGVDLYEADFYAWTQEQVTLLKQRTWEQLDLPHLIEELEDLGRRERQELRNRLGILLGYLLKWQYQPENRGNRWRATIREQRREVKLLLDDNSSLKSYLSEAVLLAYGTGVDLAVRETGLDYGTFPTDCPYLVEQALDESFWPGE